MEYRKLSELKPNPGNPRFIKDDKFKKLVKSLREFPEMMELRPVVINPDGFILGGNMRYRAAVELKLKTVPVTVATLTPEQEKEFIIKDNVSGGDWDWDLLANEWDADLLMDWGLDLPMEIEAATAEDDGYEEPETIETNIVLGDLIEIGPHRLLCGDSTNADDVEKLMDGKVAEILFTSPPYSDMRDYNGGKELATEHLSEFIPTYLGWCKFQVVNLGLQRKDYEIVPYWDDYLDKAKSCGLKLLSWNVWDKLGGGSIASATAMFIQEHEWIFVFGAEFKRLNRTVPNDLENYESMYGESWRDGKISKVREKNGSVSKVISKTYTHKQIGSVTRQTTERGPIRDNHPATFPVGLPSEYITAMTQKGEIIAEPFIGSGTTMVAAHPLGRVCYGMELDPKYCQVVIDRMKKAFPDLEVKVNGQLYETNN